MAQQNFNDEVQIPKRLRKRLENVIGYTADSFLKDHIGNPDTSMGQFNQKSFTLLHEYRKTQNSANHQKKYDSFCEKHQEYIKNIYSHLINTLSGYYLSQEETVSSRERRDFYNKNKKLKARNETQIEWKNFSLRPYTIDFIRWFLNSAESELFHDSSIAIWGEEDWKSDIKYVMRGYFIAKNQRKGFSLNGIKTIHEAKEAAKPFIPKEGLEITQKALMMGRSEQPYEDSIWFLDYIDPNPRIGHHNPDIDILYQGEDYILIHLKNERAAIEFGKKTSWCTYNSGMWKDYSDNLLFLCDATGNRYQLHFRSGQLMDEADQRVSYDELNQQYPNLHRHIKNFYKNIFLKAFKDKEADDLIYILKMKNMFEEEWLEGIQNYDRDQLKVLMFALMTSGNKEAVDNIIKPQKDQKNRMGFVLKNQLIESLLDFNMKNKSQSTMTIDHFQNMLHEYAQSKIDGVHTLFLNCAKLCHRYQIGLPLTIIYEVADDTGIEIDPRYRFLITEQPYPYSGPSPTIST